MNLFSNEMRLLKAGLDISSLRHKVLAANIANVNTPGYKRMDVDFKTALNRAMDNTEQITGIRTNPCHIPITFARPYSNFMVFSNRTSIRNDKNNVDIEYEVAEMTKNSIHYQYMISRLNSEFNMLKLAMSREGI